MASVGGKQEKATTIILDKAANSKCSLFFIWTYMILQKDKGKTLQTPTWLQLEQTQ